MAENCGRQNRENLKVELNSMYIFLKK